MGGEPPRAIQHPAVIRLDSLRAPVTVVGEVQFFPGTLIVGTLLWFGPRGAGIRRLTGRQEIQGNQY